MGVGRRGAVQRGGSEMGTGESGSGAAESRARGLWDGHWGEWLRGCPALRARGTCHESSPQVCRRGTESPPEEKRRATSGDMPAFCLSLSGPPAAQTRL